MNYYFDIRKDDVFGTTGKIRMLNAFMNLCEQKGHICYPRLTINGKDMWGKYFEMNFDYSVYDTAKQLPCDGMYNPQESPGGFQTHVIFNTETKERVDKIYNDIGSPEVAIYTRETDKASDQEVVMPPIVYIDIIKSKYLDNKILAMSDCDYTINVLKENLPNVVSLPNHRSKNFLPLHRLIKNKYNFNTAINDEVLFDELMVDILLLLKMKMIIFGTWSGILSMIHYFGNPSNVELIDVRKLQSSTTMDIINYYKEREIFLWKIIEDYYYGFITNPTSGNMSLFKK